MRRLLNSVFVKRMWPYLTAVCGFALFALWLAWTDAQPDRRLEVLEAVLGVGVSGFMAGAVIEVSRSARTSEARLQRTSTRCPQCELPWTQHSDEDMNRCIRAATVELETSVETFRCGNCDGRLALAKIMPCPGCQYPVRIFQ